MASAEASERALRVVFLPCALRELQLWHAPTASQAGVAMRRRSGNLGDEDTWAAAMKDAWSHVTSNAGVSAPGIASLAAPDLFPAVSAAQLECARSSAGFPAKRRGAAALLHRLFAHHSPATVGKPYPEASVLDTYCSPAVATAAYMARIHSYEAEGRVLVLAARLSCVCRAFRAAVDAWQPVAERKAKLYRLALVRTVAAEQHLRRVEEKALDVLRGSVGLGLGVPLPTRPSIPKLGERDELIQLDAAIAADNRCRY